ncbi:MAG: AEC family transporter [Hormoscilla sp. SP5CHS1]|nr:AEC family transporter [Hormoscilla sp. SP12CHS1]MBC6455867.1 AEC family transporter [Hormoscilla sp. SP5CHS1]
MAAVLPALVPVGFIIIIGFIAAHTLTLEKQSLSQLAIYILSPALIASSLYRTTLSAESTVLLIAGFAITSWLVYLATQGLGKLCKLSPPVQKSLIASTLFPNTGNFGLPFITFALGEAGLERAIVCLIAAAIILFSADPASIEGGGFLAGVRLTLKLPLIWAMLAGLILRLFAIELPWQLSTACSGNK